MENRPRKPRLWPGMVFALIGLNFTIVGLTIYAASAGASSHAVEPDFDRKALHWDATAQQRAHNQALGWSLDLTRIDRETITCSLLDPGRRPIAGAAISVEAFHHGHAALRRVTDLSPFDSEYRANLPLHDPGLWEFRFTVRRAGDTFTSTITRFVTGTGA